MNDQAEPLPPDTATAMQSDGPRNRPRWETWCVAVLVVYFAARLLYLALNIAPGIPPDEPTHVGIIGLYAEAPFFIEDGPETFELGLVSHQPHLYYFALGKLAALNPFGFDDLILLRLLNVVLAVLTVIAGYRLSLDLSNNPLVRVTFFVMITNTLMFTFIGASVSYDNLVNLLAVLAISSLISFIKSKRAIDLLSCMMWVLIGSLTKTTFLPLALVIGVAYLVLRRSDLGEDLRSISDIATTGNPGRRVVFGIVVVALGANVWLYGANLIRFGRPVPSCEQVLEIEECAENRIFMRNWTLGRYRDQELTFEEAIREASRITHPGDRNHAIRLLQNERAYQQTAPPPLPRWDYIQLVWTQAMKPSIFGVQAHLSMLKDPSSLLPYNLILFVAFLSWVRFSRWDGSEREWSALSVVTIFYFLFLMGYVFYKSYLASHAAFLGVQGRYLFPVIVPAYLLAARFLIQPLRRGLQIAILIIVAVVFILGDFPYFLRHDGPHWYPQERIEDPRVSDARRSH